MTFHLSPEQLLDIFKQQRGKPLHLRQVLGRLGATHNERRLVTNMLRTMVREGRLVRVKGKNYMLPEPSKQRTGRLDGTARGHAYLASPDHPGDDVRIHRSNLMTALDGDRVVAEVFRGSRGRMEGRVVEVIERTHERIVGQIGRLGPSHAVLAPRNVRIGRVVELKDPPSVQDAPDGVWIEAKVVRWADDPDQPLLAEVVEVLGKPGEQGIEILALLRDQGVRIDFPKTVLKEVESLEAPVSESELAHRRDLRGLAVATIDPATAKDHDDALSVEATADGWRLGVHIADVAQYVREGTSVDDEALLRATSIYPVDRVIPMLPERLSADLCSLRPDVDRYALSCFMDVSKRGEVSNVDLCESVIRSRYRLAYEDVQAYFDDEKKRGESSFSDYGDSLLELRKVARVLNDARMARGALDLDMPEGEVVTNEQGDTIDLARRERLESHRLVEECMLAANEAVARILRDEKLPGLYRVHGLPDGDALGKAAAGLSMFGVRLPKNAEPTPELYQRLIDQMRKRDGSHIGMRLLLRTMMRAEYNADNQGHFGLASECYCHFTSPIRRYPDLLTHRVLKRWLRNDADEAWMESVRKRLGEIANQSNMMADESESIERDATDIKGMEFMESQIGKVFEGWIAGVMRRGVFVELVRYPIEGFLPCDAIPGDQFRPDDNQVLIRGIYTRKAYRLGERVQVRVVRVNVTAGEMDLEMADLHEKSSTKKKKKKGRKKNNKKR